MKIKGDRFYEMKNGDPCHIEEVWTTAEGVTGHGRIYWTRPQRTEKHTWDGEGKSLADPQCDIVEEIPRARWGGEYGPPESDPREENG